MQDNTRKSELLYKVFFRPPIDNDHVNPEFKYMPPICDFKPITDQQIHRAIAKLAPLKAPGPNRIQNIVFTCCADLLVPFLAPIFHAMFSLETYPKDWKCSSTIVL
ncbi:hypothetical protein BDR04DRAFT_1032981, partial [Suillus decipiens]